MVFTCISKGFLFDDFYIQGNIKIGQTLLNIMCENLKKSSFFEILNDRSKTLGDIAKMGKIDDPGSKIQKQCFEILGWGSYKSNLVDL